MKALARMPEKGFSACFPGSGVPPTIKRRRKPRRLYPNVARAVYGQRRGFDTAVTCDSNGNVAEFAYANLSPCSAGRSTPPRPTAPS